MIRHKIKSKDGGTREVSLTPIKAIRYQCLECMGFVTSEVKKCTSPLCSLFPYRFGKAPGHKGKGNTKNFIEK
jgi:hypothetical protein